MKRICFCLLVLCMIGCERKEILQANLESWWNGLSQTDRANLLELQQASEPGAYEIEPIPEDNSPATAAFCLFWNELQPAQLEGFAREMQARKIERLLAETETQRLHNESVVKEFRKASATVRPLSIKGLKQ